MLTSLPKEIRSDVAMRMASLDQISPDIIIKIAGVIGQKLGLAAPTLSFHLKELSHAGLVDSRQEGRFVIYSTDFKTMNGLIAYLTENCCQGVTVTCCPPVSAGAANMARVARKAQ